MAYWHRLNMPLLEYAVPLCHQLSQSCNMQDKCTICFINHATKKCMTQLTADTD